MRFFDKYPYTDFHELNLDWFLAEFKNLVSDWEDFRTYMEEGWANLQGDFNTLYNYVHDYFDNLDVQDEIDNKLDAMLAAHQLDTPIATAAGDWLSANLATPSTPPIDTSLSVSSAAADAKTVGDNFAIAVMGKGSVVHSGNPILSDADNADIDKIYTISDHGLVSNLPSFTDDVGTLMTYSWDDSSNGGNVQIFVDQYNVMAHRIRWGTSPGTWGAWSLTSNNFQIHGNGTAVTSGNQLITDADNADVNTVYTITNTGVVSNLPSDAVTTGTLMTFSFNNNKQGGNVQLYMTSDGNLYQRMRWGSFPGTWQSWKLTSNGFLLKGRGTAVTSGNQLITDANDADINVIHTITNPGVVSNLPKGSKDTGTLMTYCFNNNKQGGNTQIFIDESGNSYYRIRWGAYPGTWGAWQVINTGVSLASLFQSMAVIGDSFASGEVYINGSLTDFPNISWLQILARANGITDASNYSKGGLTCRTWFTDAAGYAAMTADTPKQLYFVALGINDANAAIPIGTYADFTAGTHPDTFYGNLGKIKDAIITANADAIICWVTCMRFTSAYTSYSNAIIDIATQEGDLLINSNEIPYMKSSGYTQSLVSNHPVSYSYAAIAKEIEKKLSESMINNTRMKTFTW